MIFLDWLYTFSSTSYSQKCGSGFKVCQWLYYVMEMFRYDVLLVVVQQFSHEQKFVFTNVDHKKTIKNFDALIFLKVLCEWCRRFPHLIRYCTIWILDAFRLLLPFNPSKMFPVMFSSNGFTLFWFYILLAVFQHSLHESEFVLWMLTIDEKF